MGQVMNTRTHIIDDHQFFKIPGNAEYLTNPTRTTCNNGKHWLAVSVRNWWCGTEWKKGAKEGSEPPKITSAPPQRQKIIFI